MTVLAYIVLAFAGIRLLVVLSNLLFRQWLRPGPLTDEPMVSVLIPARNESQNIGGLLVQLIQHDYKNLDIWVYDDLSDDDTYDQACAFALKDERIKVIRGCNLPRGWLGKNHACHRLSRYASGSFLLFLDADVQLAPGLIRNSLAHMQKHRLNLLSLFPTQRTIGWGEKLIVPLMNWILLSLLPLLLTRKARQASLAAANGQFMLFSAPVYHDNLFHSELRNQPVEDIAIARLMKTRKFRIHTLLGGQFIYCRMYRNGAEALSGLSRSVLQFFGGSPWLALSFGLITSLGFVPVVWALSVPVILSYVFTLLIIRLMVAVMSRKNILWSILISPVQQLAFVCLLWYALKRRFTSGHIWKGRKIELP